MAWSSHAISQKIVEPFKPIAGSPLGGKMSRRAEKFLAISLANRIVAAEKCRATNSWNTFYFSRLDIFPPSGDPAYGDA